jgi:spore coat polysaccharide biosynthesis predicted glycosyltransferase SpsG
MYDKLLMLNPNIVINDILDTSYEYMCKLNEMGYFTVNFEDLGIGSKYADIIINALYERTDPPKNSYFGHKYICLRDEFFIFPLKDIKPEVKEILIIFGGSDPNNLTLRTLRSIENLGLTNVKINVILGLGYEYNNELQRYINELINKDYRIEVNKNIKIMAKHIVNADVAVTSNGRTVYEIASLGVPCISISQNEREMSHLFSYICSGIKNLGIESNVTQETIASTLKEIINNYDLRKNMNKSMTEFNLKKGTERVMRLIFNKYWEKQGHEDN